VTHLASCRCGEAKPGRVLVSQRLLDAVDELVEVEPASELSLKGFPRSISAYNIVRLKA